MTRRILEMRGLSTSLGVAAAMLACGGNTFTTDDGAGGSVGTAGSSGDGGADSGGTAGGGSATGGATTGGATATGGTVGKECSADFECPEPGGLCSTARCIDGMCTVEFIEGCGMGGTYTGGCNDASECPPPPPVCNACPNGTSACLGVDCIDGQCEVVGGSCPGVIECPTDAPTAGTPCDLPNAGTSSFLDIAQCSWGDDPRTECRTTGLCTSGSWSISSPTQPYCNEPALPADCPTSPPTGTCAGTESACWYENGTHCTCSACLGGSEYPLCLPLETPEWSCQVLPNGCPATVPQAGSPCEVQDLSCGTSCELQVVCDQGVWRWLAGACPVCAAPNTPIATPDGVRSIADLREGDLVYSVHRGAIVAVPLARTGSTPVHHHRVMRMELEDGTVLEISPGHPTGDGRTLAELHAGDWLDEQHAIRASELVPYTYDRTYDILPASETGTYFAGGALLGSTLFSSGMLEGAP